MKNDKRLRIENIVLIILAFYHCVSCTENPQRGFMDENLLIDPRIAPEGWELVDMENVPFDDEQGQISGAYIIFYDTLTPAFARFGQDVYRYQDVSKAEWHYQRMEKMYFNESSFYAGTPIYVPSQLTFSSSIADKWRFGCNGDTFLYQDQIECQYLAQYDEFIIYSSFAQFSQGEEHISISEIQAILTEIDKLIENKFSDVSEENKSK